MNKKNQHVVPHCKDWELEAKAISASQSLLQLKGRRKKSGELLPGIKRHNLSFTKGIAEFKIRMVTEAILARRRIKSFDNNLREKNDP